MDSLDKLIPLEAIYLKFKGTNFKFKEYLKYRYEDYPSDIKKDWFYIFLIIAGSSKQFSDPEISEWYSKLSVNIDYLDYIIDDKEISNEEKERLSYLLIGNPSTNLYYLSVLDKKYLYLISGKYTNANWEKIWKFFLIQLPKLGWPNKTFGTSIVSINHYDKAMKCLLSFFSVLPVNLQEDTVFNLCKIENDRPYKHTPNFYKLCLQLRILQELDVSSTKALTLIKHCLQYKSLWEDCFETIYFINKKQNFTENEIGEILLAYKESDAYKSLNPYTREKVDEEVSYILKFPDDLIFPVMLNENDTPQLLLVSRAFISGPVFVKNDLNEHLEKLDFDSKLNLVIDGEEKFRRKYFEVDFYRFVENVVSTLDERQYNSLVSSLIEKKEWEMVVLIFCDKEKNKLISKDTILKIVDECDDERIYQMIIGYNAQALIGYEKRFLKILKQQYTKISFETELVEFATSPLYDISRFMIKNHYALVKEDTKLFNSPLIILARLSIKPWNNDIEDCFEYLIDTNGSCNLLACFCFLQKPYYRNQKYYQYFLRERSHLNILTNYSDEWVGIFLRELMIYDLNKDKGMKLNFILPYLKEHDIEEILLYIKEREPNQLESFLVNYSGPKDEFAFSRSLIDELMQIDLSNDFFLQKKRNNLVCTCIEKTKEPDIKQCIQYLLCEDFKNVDFNRRFQLIKALSKGLKYWKITESEKNELITLFGNTFQKEPSLIEDIKMIIKRFEDAMVL